MVLGELADPRLLSPRNFMVVSLAMFIRAYGLSAANQDTTVHTYQIGAPDTVSDVYELEPNDLTEEVIRGGITIEKRDSVTGETPQGGASFAGIKFDIVNDSDNSVVVNGKTCVPGSVAMTITTNEGSVATTGPNALPFGDYVVRESDTNSSMLKTFTEELHVTISEDGKVHTFTAENEVVRGGIAIEKQDTQTGATPQGNADFAGITFEIVNRSANPVVVDGLDYRGEIHAIISNVSNQTQELSKGSRVGQLVITPVVIADFVSELGEQRGTGGFGSTGK